MLRRRKRVSRFLFESRNALRDPGRVGFTVTVFFSRNVCIHFVYSDV